MSNVIEFSGFRDLTNLRAAHRDAQMSARQSGKRYWGDPANPKPTDRALVEFHVPVSKLSEFIAAFNQIIRPAL